jgi:hypothetical protein
MADLKPEADASNSNQPKQFAPYKPAAARYIGKDVSFADLAPQVEPEPDIEAGSPRSSPNTIKSLQRL